MARSPRRAEAEELGGVVEERGGDFAGAELRVIDDVFEEGNVGFDAADAELAEGAVHAAAGFGEIVAPGGDFDQERVVIGGE